MCRHIIYVVNVYAINKTSLAGLVVSIWGFTFHYIQELCGLLALCRDVIRRLARGKRWENAESDSRSRAS